MGWCQLWNLLVLKITCQKDHRCQEIYLDESPLLQNLCWYLPILLVVFKLRDGLRNRGTLIVWPLGDSWTRKRCRWEGHPQAVPQNVPAQASWQEPWQPTCGAGIHPFNQSIQRKPLPYVKEFWLYRSWQMKHQEIIFWSTVTQMVPAATTLPSPCPNSFSKRRIKSKCFCSLS